MVKTLTDNAPAILSSRAQAEAVEPVVRTSSIKMTRFPSEAGGLREEKTPRRIFLLRLAVRRVWGGRGGSPLESGRECHSQAPGGALGEKPGLIEAALFPAIPGDGNERYQSVSRISGAGKFLPGPLAEFYPQLGGKGGVAVVFDQMNQITKGAIVGAQGAGPIETRRPFAALGAKVVRGIGEGEFRAERFSAYGAPGGQGPLERLQASFAYGSAAPEG